ncbi:MAG TPA: GAF domain-containing SpoIIE family protein phosphatase [Trebonia sp.]
MTGDARAGLPRRREPDLDDLAAFTVDLAGLVTSWPESAARLSGRPASAAVGRDVRDVLLTGPAQRELAQRAIAEVAAGRAWTETVAGAQLGEGRFAIRWEPLRPSSGDTPDDKYGTPDGAVVMLRRAWPQPRPGWLAEAAVGIGDSLDLGRTAAQVAEVAVPAFADVAAVYVVEHLLTADEAAASRSARGTAARRLAGRLADGTRAEVNRLLPADEVIIFDPGTPVFEAMTTGQPVLFDRLDPRSAERVRLRAGNSEAARFASFLALPLTAQGTVVGGLVLGRTTASPPFGAGELPHAEELGARAAVCIDNARLYHRERRTARALQQGLLPRLPDAPPGLEIASRYFAVGSNVVGGDWHDVIALPGGRAAVVVGDAMGHGPEAAAAMAQLRSAAHVLADVELPPRQLLYRLDRLVAEITAAPFATCVCAVAGPVPGSDGAWTCTASRAGHPPPVVVLPGGETRLLDLPAGLPLGLGEVAFEERVIDLPAGSTLALYTDGLVESHTRPLDDGLADLRAALSAALTTPDAPLEAVCEAVASRLSSYGEDDSTLVLARIRS